MPIGFDAPIPGENYTSDTKNYPWHRPPEFTDLDDAIEMTFKKLLSKKGSFGLLTMMKGGMDVATLTDIYVTSGIGSGKWTPDFALLLAGPVAHIIYLMGKSYGIKVDLGIKDDFEGPSLAFFEQLQKDKDAQGIDPEKAAEAAASVDPDMVRGAAQDQGKPGGFMGMADMDAGQEGMEEGETAPSPMDLAGGKLDEEVEGMI